MSTILGSWEAPKQAVVGLACGLELPTLLFCSFLTVSDYEIGGNTVCSCAHLFRNLCVSLMRPERKTELLSCPRVSSHEEVARPDKAGMGDCCVVPTPFLPRLAASQCQHSSPETILVVSHGS